MSEAADAVPAQQEEPKPEEQNDQEKKEEAPKPDINCKVVLLGNEGVGKTSLACYYKNGKKPEGELPIISPNFQKDEEVDGQKVHIIVWDQSCSKEDKEMRIKSYHDTSVFVLCMALDDMNSLKGLLSTWIKEVLAENKEPNIVIVGTKSDKKNIISDSVLKNISHRAYCEVSSENGAGVDTLFHTIAEIMAKPDEHPSKKDEVKKPTNQSKSECCLLI